MARLTGAQRDLLDRSRRGVLGTIASSGRPRLVPIAFAVTDDGGELILYSALDEKPKSVADPRQLARVRDIIQRPKVSVLVDEWREDWSRLAWLRLDGTATLIEPVADGAAEHALGVRLLRDRYPQYAQQRLEERPMLRVRVERVRGWIAER